MNLDVNKIGHLLGPNLATYDPYDLWKTKLGRWLKRIYYQNGKITIPIVAPFFMLDAYTPRLIRAFVEPQEYPIVRAFSVLSALNFYKITSDRKFVDLALVSVKWLIENQSRGYHGACWGINFPWVTKCGYYPPSTPFITHTPYCVEALVKYSDITRDKESLDTGLSSLGFLENDLTKLIDTPDKLALSYGPEMARRAVINANSYAMMMYALLANRLSDKRAGLLEKGARLFNFIISRQLNDGGWLYYDGQGKDNFIDCFHTCFVLKNLIKYGKLAEVNVSDIVNKGLQYILEHLLDSKYFLARRFSVSANPSLVKFDLYDQAELLNLLCLTERMDLARRIYDSIMKYFYISSKGTFGYQIDLFGKLNKMKYLRWAVMPTIYVLSEYYKSIANEKD